MLGRLAVVVVDGVSLFRLVALVDEITLGRLVVVDVDGI